MPARDGVIPEDSGSLFAIGIAVNDEDTLRSNISASPLLTRYGISIVEVKGAQSAASAYNKILAATSEPYLILAHQDVYLPEGFEVRLCRAIEFLNRSDPGWAVLGIIGVDASGDVVGLVWSNGLQRKVGRRLDAPHQVVSIDELLIVLRRDSGIRFDEGLEGFHLYGTDIVLEALEKKLTSYVIDAPVVHNSVSVKHLDQKYVKAYKYMQRKWSHKLPLKTLIVPITSSLWPIYRSYTSVLKRRMMGLSHMCQRHPDPKVLAEHLVDEDNL